MNIRTRLVLLLVATTLLVQGVTAAVLWVSIRAAVWDSATTTLVRADEVFTRSVDDAGRRLASSMELLAGDSGLRKNFVDRDYDSALRVLEIGAQRAGAGRAFVILPDSSIIGRAATPRGRFPFPDLIATAGTSGSSYSLATLNGKPYLLALAPVRWTNVSGFICTMVPLDTAFLTHLEETAGLPQTMALAMDPGTDRWTAVAVRGEGASLTEKLPPRRVQLGTEPVDIEIQGGTFRTLVQPLDLASGSSPVAVVFGDSISDRLAGFKPVAFALAGLAAAGALICCLSGMLIARNLARPMERLLAATRRFEAGDYSSPPEFAQTDEIGQLSQALASMARAIAEREERIRGWSQHDPITGLLNRTGLTQVITQEGAHISGAVLLVGLLRLQEIVNTVGRDIGDRLMQEAGNRLAEITKGAAVACVSDHAFAAFLPSMDRTAAVELAGEIVLAFERPYQERHLAIDCTAAVGIAMAPEHGTEAGLLLQRADVALLAAQPAPSRIAIYDPLTDPRRPEHLSLMVDLRQAVERKELSLAYQPKLDLAAGRIAGVEALVRWHHEFRGLVPPDLFIPLAEETGNIGRLTRWALATGIAQAARWLNRGLSIRVSVNLSVRDLADPQLPRRVASMLAAHDVPAEYLLLEVTESAIMGEPDTAIAVLNAMADQGVALSIDDFGVGHSSLTYLRRLPVREIKIDKSFVLNLVKSSGDQKIVQSVIELGHRLGYKVTAEGVEDEDSLIGLGVLGCDYAQGYHVSKPLSREQMEHFFTDSRWPIARIMAMS